VSSADATRSSAARSPGRAAALVLASSLIFVELLGGVQRYLSQTVLPLVATELDGADLYGPLDAAAQAPMFLMMPVGAWLLSRYRVGPLLAGFTAVTVVGAATCAAAQQMEVFIAGTAVRAFAAGALATISMGVISRGLPPRYRQLVLAGMSGIWVVSSVLGPVYAVSVSELLGWRWAMLLYLPLLIAARGLIARYMPERTAQVPQERAPWAWSIVLATGSAVIALPLGVWSVAAVVAGALLMLRASAAVLPDGTFRALSGRRAALSALTVTAAVYFGSTIVLSVVAFDGFGLPASRFGYVIAAPGVAWAVSALWTGSRPATRDDVFRRRMLLAGTAMTAGVVVLLLATSPPAAVPAMPPVPSVFVGLLVGGALTGLGMGTLYPDLLGRCLARPEVDDGISEDRMAAAVNVAESVGLAIATTAAFSWLGTGFGLVDDPARRAQLLYAAMLPLAVLMLVRLTAAARQSRTGPR